MSRFSKEFSTDEPELEFDDHGTELSSSREVELWDNSADEVASASSSAELEEELEQALISDVDQGPFRAGAITPDGLIDEDFEAELGRAEDGLEKGEFCDIEQYGVVEVAGDDKYGRKVIVVSACKLPTNKTFDNQRLLLYIKHTLDRYVEQDYVLVYFHYGLSSANKPKLRWLVQAYRELSRKYKKNLKTLYLVHPTYFIKVLWNIFCPFVSVKFRQKLVHVHYLMELKDHVPFDQLSIPQTVLEYDARKSAADRVHYPYDSSAHQGPSKHQQFGVSLQYLDACSPLSAHCGSRFFVCSIRSNGRTIVPVVVDDCVSYMRSRGGAESEGIFRKCANVQLLNEVQRKYDAGEVVDFDAYTDINIPAGILKKFFRELEEPLMTYDLFEPITRLHLHGDERQIMEVKRILQDELPDENYVILKYVMQFLVEVSQKGDLNKMNAGNLAVVFGPNLAWSKGQANLVSVETVIHFTKLLLLNFDAVFVR